MFEQRSGGGLSESGDGGCDVGGECIVERGRGSFGLFDSPAVEHKVVERISSLVVSRQEDLLVTQETNSRQVGVVRLHLLASDVSSGEEVIQSFLAFLQNALFVREGEVERSFGEVVELRDQMLPKKSVLAVHVMFEHGEEVGAVFIHSASCSMKESVSFVVFGEEDVNEEVRRNEKPQKVFSTGREEIKSVLYWKFSSVTFCQQN